jgi:hypothetical protein
VRGDVASSLRFVLVYSGALMSQGKQKKKRMLYYSAHDERVTAQI